MILESSTFLGHQCGRHSWKRWRGSEDPLVRSYEETPRWNWRIPDRVQRSPRSRGKLRLILKRLQVESRSRSYKQNSSVEFNSTQESTNQISHVTNFSFIDWPIPALSQSLSWNFVYMFGSLSTLKEYDKNLKVPVTVKLTKYFSGKLRRDGHLLAHWGRQGVQVYQVRIDSENARQLSQSRGSISGGTR